MTKLTQYNTELQAIENKLILEDQISTTEQDLKLMHRRIAELRQTIYRELKSQVDSSTKQLTGISIYALHNIVPEFNFISKADQIKLCQELGFQLEVGGNLQRGKKST